MLFIQSFMKVEASHCLRYNDAKILVSHEYEQRRQWQDIIAGRKLNIKKQKKT